MYRVSFSEILYFSFNLYSHSPKLIVVLFLFLSLFCWLDVVVIVYFIPSLLSLNIISSLFSLSKFKLFLIKIPKVLRFRDCEYALSLNIISVVVKLLINALLRIVLRFRDCGYALSLNIISVVVKLLINILLRIVLRFKDCGYALSLNILSVVVLLINRLLRVVLRFINCVYALSLI